jgi:putative ABC transport system ATP-binding protein
MKKIFERVPNKPAEKDQTADFIRFYGLQKSFQEGNQTRTVLHNTQASFARGESVAILGESGSGKSTLLNLISGIDQSEAGSVWLDGRDLTAMNEQDRTLFRRHHIGVIFQFFNLIPTLSVWENVALPLELSGSKNRAVTRRLVLADEPTGNLDEETGHKILDLLDSLTRQAGKNMIMVTHSQQAAAYADRILRLQNGQLVDTNSIGSNGFAPGPNGFVP